MTQLKQDLDQTEKNAIIALQTILNAREPVSEEKYDRFTFFISKLPPHRALIVFGHTLNAVSERMPDNDPYKIALKRMGHTITDDMGSDYVDLLEKDQAFYRTQKDKLAANLCDMAEMMDQLAEEKRA